MGSVLSSESIQLDKLERSVNFWVQIINRALNSDLETLYVSQTLYSLLCAVIN